MISALNASRRIAKYLGDAWWAESILDPRGALLYGPNDLTIFVETSESGSVNLRPQLNSDRVWPGVEGHFGRFEGTLDDLPALAEKVGGTLAPAWVDRDARLAARTEQAKSELADLLAQIGAIVGDHRVAVGSRPGAGWVKWPTGVAYVRANGDGTAAVNVTAEELDGPTALRMLAAMSLPADNEPEPTAKRYPLRSSLD
ncbi:hypothetical protein [Streptomyces sp. MJM8645]|uniref:hypothetical protein n=1 Tax=Streptomycetaceae TaxID=2062 RepID=UPI0007AFAB61|nr:hypothetical protein [Streptomyces sp. MJM8645]